MEKNHSGTNKPQEHKKNAIYHIEKSAVVTIIGIMILFSFSIFIILLMPRHVDPTWSQPSSRYQVQMYEMADPNFYISSAPTGDYNHQFVYHLKKNFTLLSFQETQVLRIIAPKDLEKYVTRLGDKPLKTDIQSFAITKPY